MNLATWLILGALLGWGANCIARADDAYDDVEEQAVVLVGALIGGAMTLRHREFSAEALLMAAIAATALLVVVHFLHKRLKAEQEPTSF